MITITLILNAVLFGVFGLLLLVAPEKLSLAMIALSHPTALTEVRAFYGGVELAIAVFFVLAFRNINLQQAAIILSVLIYAGLTVGRVYGLFADGREGLYVPICMMVEVSLLVISCLALNKLG